MDTTLPVERITSKIFLIRGLKVMLDRDLADLYGDDTAQLKRAVRRNIERFPKDFMIELTKEELEDWRCQFGTSSAASSLFFSEPIFLYGKNIQLYGISIRYEHIIRNTVI